MKHFEAHALPQNRFAIVAFEQLPVHQRITSTTTFVNDKSETWHWYIHLWFCLWSYNTASLLYHASSSFRPSFSFHNFSKMFLVTLIFIALMRVSDPVASILEVSPYSFFALSSLQLSSKLCTRPLFGASVEDIFKIRYKIICICFHLPWMRKYGDLRQRLSGRTNIVRVLTLAKSL